MSGVRESIQAFLKYRDPPAPNAPESAWRSFFLYNLLALRQGQEVLRAGLAKLAHDLDGRLTVVEEDAWLNGRQLALHRGTLRHLGTCVEQLGKDLEALTPCDGEVLKVEPATPAEVAS